MYFCCMYTCKTQYNVTLVQNANKDFWRNFVFFVLLLCLPHAFLAWLRNSCKNEMAPAPAPELCFLITWLWLRLRSGCALLNKFGIHIVLLEESKRVIPTYFELILLLLPGLGSRKEFGLELSESVKILLKKSDFG